MGGPRQGVAFELLAKEKISIFYQGPRPSQEQWDRYISFMQTISAMPDMRFLVLVEGPPPTAANQRAIRELVKHARPVALVSSSTAMRFVVSTFALVNRSIRFFSPAQLSDALAYIQCSTTEVVSVYDVLQRLQVED